MQKLVIFVKKSLKINIKFRDPCYYTGEYRDVAHGICNSKYSISKKMSIVFHN